MAEAEIELTESTLIIHLKGLSTKILAFLSFWGGSRHEIPLAHVVDATEVDPEFWEKFGVTEERDVTFFPVLALEWEKKWRWGRMTYHDKAFDRQTEGKIFGIPSTFTYHGFRTALVLTNNKRKAMAIRLTDEYATGFFGEPALLVLPVTDPAGTAAWIREAVQAYKSS